MSHHAGFGAIVGRPKLGKSTLLNAPRGPQVAIVSPNPQTPRNRGVGTFGTVTCARGGRRRTGRDPGWWAWRDAAPARAGGKAVGVYHRGAVRANT